MIYFLNHEMEQQMRLMKIFWVLLMGCFYSNLFAAWHFTAADVNALHSKPADHRIAYGTDALQFGDLRLPSGAGPYPVAIIIHGGCWLAKIADLQNSAALADALRELGIATWNIEYRREDSVGGGWPGTFLDVANAADYLQKIAKQYSLDLDHVIVIGHSAGGHLALWLAARHQLPATSQLYMPHPLKIRGVIALAGVPNLEMFRSQATKVCGADVIGNLLGTTPDQVNAHYKEASPSELLPLGVPQVLIFGTDDKVVPYIFGINYQQAARKKGEMVQVLIVDGAAHHEFTVPNSISWPTVKSAIASLLH